MSSDREPQVIDAFLALTDTLVTDFDALEMLTTLAERSVELLDVTAAGIILTDGTGADRLSVAASSSEASQLLESFAVAIDAGPCVDCVRSGEPVVICDVDDDAARRRWPRFTAGATECGFRAAHALPLRHRGQVIGVLTLLHTDPHALVGSDARLGQALADVATIGLLHERGGRRADTVVEQLQSAINSRVVVEQAKGVLAQHAGICPEEAFGQLRAHCREHGGRLSDLCRAVITGDEEVRAVVAPLAG